MPSSYAHYRFGTQVLPGLPEEVRDLIRRYRNVFDVGTHGPDLFFYYYPAIKTAVRKLGQSYHRQSGKEFFGAACRRLRLKRSDAGMAYLYGVLAHYCLDSVCHPMICSVTENGPVCHTALESEFDRYLLTMDGKLSPHTQDLSGHLRLSDAECEAVASFYPPAAAGHIRKALRGMVQVTKMVSVSNPVLRGATGRILSMTGESNRGLMMTDGPDARCAHLDAPLMELYETARGNYPSLARQIGSSLKRGLPLGKDFEKDFG